jgi:hypothetical protein
LKQPIPRRRSIIPMIKAIDTKGGTHATGAGDA